MGVLDSLGGAVMSWLGRGARSVAGGSSMTRRIGVGAAWWGGGELAQSFVEHKEGEKRAYYGDSRYESYYGKGASALSGALGLYTKGHAIGSLLGRDPINRAINSIKYRKGSVAGRQLVSEYKTLKEMHGPGIDRLIQSKKVDIDRYLSVPRLGFRSLGLYAGVAAAEFTGDSRSVMMGLTTGVAADTLLGFGKKGRSKAQLRSAQADLGLTDELLKQHRAKKASGHSYGIGKSLAVAGIGAGAGYYLGAVNTNRSAEGPITSFEKYNEQGVSRMNFSTAGLGLAIHRNQRRY
ncbi:MAG: hypothetical protein KDH96_05330 [Candidatus Riesia sp.]|nr:hypothetical protein [Candidatus Riesia sp.]